MVNASKYILLLLLSLSGFVGLAHGATMSYYLDTNNIGLDDSEYWGTVTISDGANGNIDFTISLNTYDDDQDDGGFTYLENFGMQDFFFNSNYDLSSENVSINDPYEWNFLSDREYNAGGGYGKFELQYTGTGDTRANPLSFTINGIEGDTIWDYAISNDEGYLFATHIADFYFDGDDGITSGKFSTSISPVPLPATVWLFGSALVGFVGFARRRSV